MKSAQSSVQQQQQQQLPSQQQHYLQAGSSIQQFSPYSAQVQSNYTTHSGSVPSSVDNHAGNAPSSVPPSAPGSQLQPSSVPPHSVLQQAPLSNPSPAPQPQPQPRTDPVAAAKSLILRDLRHSLLEVNVAAEKIAQRSLGTVGSDTSDKRLAAPSSNLPNPLSVNPQSVHNPMSVNAPNSVKSVDERPSVCSDELASPTDAYAVAMNKFLNTCSEIERNLQVISEVQRQTARFDDITVKTLPQQPQDCGAANSTAQLVQPYVDVMNTDKRHIKHNVDRVVELQRRLLLKKKRKVVENNTIGGVGDML